MKLLDGFKIFFNPAFSIQKIFTLFGGGDDEAEYVPMQPANVSTGFGTALADPERGIYNYTLDPRLAAMRDIFYGATPSFMPTPEEQQFAQQVTQGGMSQYGTGQNFLNQALGMNPQEVGQQYYSDIQDLMAMDRAEEEARLASTLFKTGRTGVGAGVEGGYINPEQFALLKAREQANTRLGIEAEQYGRQRQQGDVGFANQLMGSGLTQYGSGYQAGLTPYQSMASLFGLGTNLEQLGMQNSLGTAISVLPIHQQIQANRQAVENANASGGKGGGLLGGIASAGLDYAMGGGFGGLGGSLSSIWSGTSPSSGILGSLGIDTGWGGNFGTWNPIDTNIGMGGYTGPANWGGGTIGPSW